MSTRQVRSTLRLSASVWWLFAELLLQHPSRSQQATSGVRRLMSASCEVTQDVGGTLPTCPRLLPFSNTGQKIPLVFEHRSKNTFLILINKLNPFGLDIRYVLFECSVSIWSLLLLPFLEASPYYQ